MEMHILYSSSKIKDQAMKDRIIKALKETIYNPELFFHFWLKDHETAMLAHSQTSIQTMRGLADNIQALNQETSFFQFDRRSNLLLCIDSCKACLKTKKSLQLLKNMDGFPCYLQRNNYTGIVQSEKKIVVNRFMDKKILILKALQASGYDAEVFLSLETKDWEAASLAFKTLSVVQMKELIEELQAKLKATSFFSFKRRKELESCIFACQGNYGVKTLKLTAEESEQLRRYLMKKDIAASSLAQNATKNQKPENKSSTPALKEEKARNDKMKITKKHSLFDLETEAQYDQLSGLLNQVL